MLKMISKAKAGMTDTNWDSYVEKAYNGTIFHQIKFLSYHPVHRFDNHHLLFMKRDKIIALATFAKITGQGSTKLASYPGASWGGIISAEPLTYQHANEIGSLIIEFATDNNCDELEITVPPAIYSDTLSDSLTFCLLQKGFSYKKRELTTVVDLEREWVSFDRSVTKAVNKSIDSQIITTKSDSDCKAFYTLLESNINEKGGYPTHKLTELIALKEKYPAGIEFWNAYKQNKYVGGLCNWEVKKGIWLIFYSCYDKEYTSDRVLNRLFHDSIRYYQSNKASYVDFGTSSINMVVNEGLLNFKELYSATSVFRDTLSLQL